MYLHNKVVTIDYIQGHDVFCLPSAVGKAVVLAATVTQRPVIAIAILPL